MSKVCTMCHKEKLRTEFCDNISCADGYTPKCKKCTKKMSHQYYLQRKLKKKNERLLPFVYHTRAPHPEDVVPDKNNLLIQQEPYKHIFK